MHKYWWHVGDYRKDTGHLSYEEHGMYRWLIDQCFEQETPLTTDIRTLMRKMRLTSDQKDTLETLLEEFFVLTPDGWVHDRVSRELSKAYDKSDKARASAEARWAKKGKNANAMRTHSDGKGSASNSQSEGNATPVPHNPSTPERSAEKRTASNGRMKRPTAKEVQEYLDSVGETRFTGEQFVASYEAKGWLVGRNRTPMKNWKASVTTWRQARDKDDQPNNAQWWQGGI